MTPIKVMHIINDLGIGGAEVALLRASEALLADPRIDTVVVSLQGVGPLREMFRARGVPLREFTFRLFTPLLNRLDPYFRLRLFLFARKERPDIVHGHLEPGQRFATVLGLLMRIPVVVTVHDTLDAPGRWQKTLDRKVTRFIAVSDSVREHIERTRGIPSDRIQVIPNGVSVDEFASARKRFDPDRPVFGYVGRLLRSKGIEHAMRALAALREDHPGIVFRIWGTVVFPDEMEYLSGLVCDNGWDFVEFMGPTDDVVSALAQIDVFVLASESEGFSIATLEAAAAAKPIIGTRVGILPEVVVDEESGYLVPFGDVQAISDAARHLIEDDDMVMFGDRACAAVSKRFNIRQVGLHLSELYRSLDV